MEQSGEVVKVRHGGGGLPGGRSVPHAGEYALRQTQEGTISDGDVVVCRLRRCSRTSCSPQGAIMPRHWCPPHPITLRHGWAPTLAAITPQQWCPPPCCLAPHCAATPVPKVQYGLLLSRQGQQRAALPLLRLPLEPFSAPEAMPSQCPSMEPFSAPATPQLALIPLRGPLA